MNRLCAGRHARSLIQMRVLRWGPLTAVRHCAAGGTAPPPPPTEPSTANATNASSSTASEGSGAATGGAMVEHAAKDVTSAPGSGFLHPSDDPVLEYARHALTRDGRDKVPEAIIWAEDTTYPPILARGKKNFYEYTDDIPKHVRPFWGHEWYQQREYFQSMRSRRPWRDRLLQYTVVSVILGGLLVVIGLMRIWMQQPKDLQDMRTEMLQHAYGRVLEMAAGHGQNIGLYPFAVHEIVMCDSNAQQLQTLRYRIPQTAYPKYEVRRLKTEMLEEFADAEFDCVIDMFGLCHYRDPVMALRQMQRVVKPTGVILLIEHGATKYPPVNWFLDKFEQRHTVNTHGCKWNQPVMDYLRQSRLEVRELRNKHFGTTYYVVAYPENIDNVKAAVEAATKSAA